MRDEGEEVSMRVVQAVADHEGVDPVELDPPLHSVINTSALDSMFSSTKSGDRTGGELMFGYQGYTIRVDSSGSVDVVEDDSLQADQPSANSVEETCD